MNIRTAYKSLSQKEFFEWAMKNGYYYFIAIEGNRERGFVYSKNKQTKYEFNYIIKQ